MRRSQTALLFAALALGTLATPALPCAAQPSGGAESEEKRTRLFKEGKAAADAGEWQEAAAKFRQVVVMRSAPKALIALGVAEEHLNHFVAALAAYKQAREEAADKAIADDLKTANAALEAIRPRIPRLLFSPPGVLEDAKLEIDGAPSRAEETGILVDPGDHSIVAKSTAKGTFRLTLSVREGEQRTVEVVFGSELGPTPTGTVDPGGPAPDTGRSLRPPTGAIVVGAAGIVVAGIGATLWGLGSGQYAESDRQCPGAACTKPVIDSGNAARSQMIAGDVMIGLGAAALAGAGVWWIVSATSSGKKGDKTGVFLAPRPGGLDLHGTF